jgi:hypothetical protein
MILATDMAEHKSHVDMIKFKVENKDITKEKANGYEMIELSNENDKFNS